MVAAICLCIAIIGSVSSYLLISREHQTEQGALSNASNRAQTMREVLDRFVGAQSASAAVTLAAQPALATALSSPDPSAALTHLFSTGPSATLPGTVVMVADGSGRVIWQQAEPGGQLAAPPVINAVIRSQPACQLMVIDGQPISGSCGVEVLSDGRLSLDVAVPVRSGQTVVGAVAYLAPVDAQLPRFEALFNYPTGLINVANPDFITRTDATTTSTGAAPGEVKSAIAGNPDVINVLYTAPGGVQVAGSFVALAAPIGTTPAAYVGVEAPISGFLGAQQTDINTLLLISLLAILITILVVALFVNRFVRRPIARLERGVAKIAQGDYSSPIAVRSGDELGRLAQSVNQMRDSIADSVTEIEAGRERLSKAVQRVSDVSQALTTTTTGVIALQREVVRSALGIVADGTVATLYTRDDDDTLRDVVADPPDAEAPVLDVDDVRRLLAGERVTVGGDGTTLLGVPMFHRDKVAGALVVTVPADAAATSDIDLLAVLANNAAVATENTRLFEQERETVQRLRELDSMKNDFLATVQHELRTPLTAIVGISDLLEMCWEVWPDEKKLESVKDVQMAAANLYDIVETIIDFALLGDAALGLNPAATTVRPAMESVVSTITDKYRGTLPVPIELTGDAAVEVFGDPTRFEQVMRAVIENAVKFSDGEGVVTVHWSYADGERMVDIAVTDLGIGIEADDLPRMFDQFFQADPSVTRRFGGTGMGLALARRLAEAHGGILGATSQPGKGTTVTIRWPAVPDASGAEARQVAETRGEASAEPHERSATVPVQ